MGIFVYFGSVKGVPPEVVEGDLVAFAERNGLHRSTSSAVDFDDLVTVFPPELGWTPLIFTNQEAPWNECIMELSARHQTLAVFADIYDSQLWRCFMYEGGRLFSKYISDRGQLGEDEDAATWLGAPEAVSSAFGVSRSIVEGYLRPKVQREGVKVRPSDQFTWDDPWVFTDFLNALGVRYPDDVDSGREVPLVRKASG